MLGWKSNQVRNHGISVDYKQDLQHTERGTKYTQRRGRYAYIDLGGSPGDMYTRRKGRDRYTQVST